MNEFIVNSEELEWKEAPGYPTGTLIKVLREEEEAKTFLLKLPEGFDMESHSHLETEEHFILEGQYESGGKVFGRGTYRYIPRGTTHGPFITSKGAVILVTRHS